MTHDITIPPEAVEAAARAIFDAAPFREEEAPLHEQSAQYQALTRAYATAAIAAALNAWPGMTYAHWRAYGEADRLVLPVPQKESSK